MKVNPITDVASNEIPRHQPGAAGASDARPVPPVAPADRVELSPASRLAQPEAVADADIRVDKVAEIREQIDNGTFKVNAYAVAERMISESASLLQTLTKPPAPQDVPRNSQEDFGAGPANERTAGPDR